ncbi:MAG TPA: hypothetical protein VFA59_16880, partial [Vicinamibacterales bacterium]|nr:hypothetical protein [Vicinamibacterales bacterium]
SSQPRVEAYGSSQVSTAGAVPIDVKSSAVTIAAENAAQITGTPVHLTIRQPLSSIEQWCANYGIPIVDGVITLFKAVRDDYRSEHGFSYAPGTIPIAPDWDGGRQECGGGLHFSPRPVMALGFDRDATKFLACPIAIADIRPPHHTDSYQNKVKARGCCGPVVEVDLDGEVIGTGSAVAV